jgi:molybdate transport system substrate-binding protein
MERGALSRILVLFVIGWGILIPSVYAGEVMVAVAANFLNPLKEIAEEFEKDSGHRLSLVPGSSGRLYAQITNGAPFDVLLSADSERPHLLERVGLAVEGTRFTYAIGRLSLWSREPGLIGESGEQVLRSGNIKHLAIANPKTAPYGQAAVQVMTRLGLWDRLQPLVVQGENIGQAFQFVASGNAELGFVALSQVLDPRNQSTGSRWDVPADLHDPLRQDAVLLAKGQGNPAARAFLEFLRSPQARLVIERYGYGLEAPR